MIAFAEKVVVVAPVLFDVVMKLYRTNSITQPYLNGLVSIWKSMKAMTPGDQLAFITELDYSHLDAMLSGRHVEGL